MVEVIAEKQFIKNQITLALSLWDKDPASAKIVIENLITVIWTEEVLKSEIGIEDRKIPPVIDSDKYRYAGPGKKGIDWLLGRDKK